MKHARPDYDRIQDPEKHIPDDEPVLLIRGQDKFGWVIAVVYAIINYLHGSDNGLTSMALAQAVRMFNWPKKVVPDYIKYVGQDTWVKPDERGHYQPTTNPYAKSDQP